jgi:hypothetical protein
MAVAANGDLYVALMTSGGRGAPQTGGGVAALHDANGDGKYEVVEKIGSGSTTGVALRNGYLYLAHPTVIERYKMTPGQLKPTGPAEVIVTGLPDERQHEDKGIAFDGRGGLYINVGAPSNACQNPIAVPARRAWTRARSSRSTAASGGSTRTRRVRRRRWGRASHRLAPVPRDRVARQRALHRDEQPRSARRLLAAAVHAEGERGSPGRADVPRDRRRQERLRLAVLLL